MIRWSLVITGMVFLLGILSCRSRHEEVKYVDFSKKMNIQNYKESRNGLLRVAVASMTSPKQTLVYYQNLIQYIARKLNKKPHFIQRKTYREVNDLLAQGKLDLAFICSGALVDAWAKGIPLRVVAIPVINGQTYYHALIIVRKDSPYHKFDDLRGKRFAFTDPLSHTGYRYPLYLLKLRHSSPEEFFRTTFFTYAHDYSIQAVSRGIADGASVDELIYAYLKKTTPEAVKNIRVIHKSQPFGMPPVVCPAQLYPELAWKIQKILFHMHSDAQGKQILEKLNIQRFTSADSTSYDSVRKIYAVVQSHKQAL